MIKKMLLGSAVLAGTTGFFFGTDAFSYLSTSAGKLRSEVKESVPLDFEIERARNMVGDLIPDIRKNMHVIAQEEVEIEGLRDEMARTEKNLNTEQEKLLALRRDLSNSEGKFHYAGGRKATERELRNELGWRFERFQTAEATYKAKLQMLEAREKSLSAAREKLEGMLAAKRDLEVQVHNLEARLKMLQAMQTTSQFQFDDSQLSRCKKMVTELRKRLDVAERILEQDGRVVETLSMEAEAPEDIEQQVDKYFGTDQEISHTGRVAL